jgi:hypothetical protein
VPDKVPDTFLSHENRMAAASIPVPDTQSAPISKKSAICSIFTLGDETVP